MNHGSDKYLRTAASISEGPAIERFDHRKMKQPLGYKRGDDPNPSVFNPVEKVIWEFERWIGQSIEEMNTLTHAGKRLRGELFICLKDTAG